MSGRLKESGEEIRKWNERTGELDKEWAGVREGVECISVSIKRVRKRGVRIVRDERLG